jgi:WD40 repeat protein
MNSGRGPRPRKLAAALIGLLASGAGSRASDARVAVALSPLDQILGLAPVQALHPPRADEAAARQPAVRWAPPRASAAAPGAVVSHSLRSPVAALVEPDGSLVVRVEGHATWRAMVEGCEGEGATAAGGLRWRRCRGVDELLWAAQEGVEQLLVVRGPGAVAAEKLRLPPGYRAAARGGIVELQDGRGVARGRVRADGAWDAAGRSVQVHPTLEGDRLTFAIEGQPRYPVVIDPLWTDAGTTSFAHSFHTATQLPSGKVLIAGGTTGASGVAELFEPSTGTFTLTATMRRYRAHHAAALLASGRVLLAGGSEDDLVDGVKHSTSEIYDPDTGTFSDAAAMPGSYPRPTATLLLSGDVLFTGAERGDVLVAPESVYRAASGLYAPTPPAESFGDAQALLPSGKVLLFSGNLGFATEYDPEANLFQPCKVGGWVGSSATLLPPGDRVLLFDHLLGASPFSTYVVDASLSPVGDPSQISRNEHARAVLAADGRVLLVGGSSGPQIERYDPAKEVFVPAGALRTPRLFGLTATPLPSGKILVVGGALTRAELLDPGLASVTSSELTIGACQPLAGPMEGGALLAGGWTVRLDSPYPFLGALRFRADVGLLESLPSVLWGGPGSAFPLSHGEFLLAGGLGGQILRYDPDSGRVRLSAGGQPTNASILALSPGKVLAVGLTSIDEVVHGSSAFLSPDPGITPGPSVLVPRKYPALARLPSGEVLALGGGEKRAEILDPQMLQPTRFTKGSMVQFRERPTVVPVSVGGVWRLLVSGGSLPDKASLSSLELYDPQSETFELLGAQPRGADGHSATLLPSGKVLLAGGLDAAGNTLDTADLFDPDTRTLSPSASTMREPRVFPRSTTLDDGRILLAGSCDIHREVRSVEVYDPATDSFSHPAAPFQGRQFPTMTLLPSGKVLLAGGSVAGSTPAASADLLAPDGLSSVPVGPMTTARREHTATQIPGGDVLLVGGSELASAEIFGSVAERFEPTAAAPLQARQQHAALLLGTGEVLITGGLSGSSVLGSTELFDPKTGQFHAGPPMLHPRRLHGMGRLPSGRVLVVGGNDAGGVVSSAEIFDPRTNLFSPGGELPVPAVDDPTNPLVGQSQPGVLHVVGSDSGGVIVAGDQIIYRYDPESDSLLYLDGGPDQAFGFSLLPGGDLVSCGGVSCLAKGDCLVSCNSFLPAAGALSSGVSHGVNRKGAAAVRLSSGDLLLQAAAPLAQGTDTSFAIYRAAPVTAPRPVLLTAPGQLTPGVTAELTGSRFRARAVAGGGSLPANGEPPGVVFLPVDSGEPVRGEISAWQDDQISFRMQRSSQHGPGWIHVLIDGVSSGGLYAELLPVARGQACGADGECASGHCAEGVCCDRGCSGGCESCLAARRGGGEDGSCGPLAAGRPPRSGCEKEAANVCSPTGVCDGSGACELPATTTGCVVPGVAAGRCFGGQCVVPPPASCDASDTRAIDLAGRVTECAPFRCRQGVCLAQCASRLDCSDGLRCADDGRCLPLLDAGSPASCALGRGTGSLIESGWIGLGLLALGARRRRGRRGP